MSDDDNTPDETEGIKNLRKQFEQVQKTNKEQAELLAKYAAKERSVSVAEILKSKGLPEKAASLYTGEDASEDAVGKWAEQYKDVFSGGAEAPAEEQLPDLNADAARRTSEASFGNVNSVQHSPGVPIGDLQQAINHYNNTPEEQLMKEGWLPKVDIHGREIR